MSIPQIAYTFADAVTDTSQSSFFCRRMQNYATFIQYYATLCNPRRYIATFSPPYRRERPFLRR